MKKLALAVAAATFGTSALAAPLGLSFDTSKLYVGALGSYQLSDSTRFGEDGYGGQFLVGLPVHEVINLEAIGYGVFMPRDVDDTSDLLYGFGVDALVVQRSEKLNTFLLAGFGVQREDVSKEESTAPYVNGGFGVMAALTEQLSLRADARLVLAFNEDTNLGRSGKIVNDGRFNLGLQYGFGFKPKYVPPADTDGDGVVDPTDQCPNTPPGTAVDPVGCPLAPADSDGDGVADTIDQCPDTPAGSVVDERGCPPVAPVGNPDLDADGVLNAADQCPDTPAGFKVDGVGCMVEQTVALQAVNFEFGSDALTAEAKAILDGIAKSLAAQTAVKVQVTGHTDSLGPQSYNLTLSQKRAASVLAYLTAAGVDAARLSSEGEGEFAPIASNDSEQGRAQNRRVEFKILTQ